MKRQYILCIAMHSIFLYFPSQSYSKIEPELWLKAFKSVETSVKSAYSNCGSMDIVFDTVFTGSLDQIVHAWHHHIKSSEGVPDVHQDTILMTDLDTAAVNDSRVVEYKRLFNARYRTPCSLILYQMDSKFAENNFLVRPEIGDWPDGIAVLTPSLASRAFFVFYSHYNWAPEYVNQISNFTSFILHSIFAVPEAGGINFYRSFPQIQAPLAAFGRFDDKSSEDFFKVLLFEDHHNFEGEPIITLTCLMCVPTLGPGAQPDMYGALMRTIVKFNGTLEIEEVFGIPGRGFNEDGEFDDFTRPLVIGSEAAFSTVTILSDTIAKFLYVTHPHIHDGAYFITRRPKKIKIKSFTIIQAPLDKLVWVAIVVSAVSLFGFLNIVSYWKNYSTPSGTILEVIIKPIVEQTSVSEHLGNYLMIKEESVVKGAVGIWFLSLIVLVCIYKSILVSVVVIPQYDVPPRSYKELVESDYDIGAIFYTTTLEGYMMASNSSVSRTLMSRIVEYNYIEPECYTMVLQGRKVCLGYSSALTSIGNHFTVDVHGRSLIMSSKDAHYFIMVSIGVSKYYPMFADPLDFFMKLWTSGALGHLFQMYAEFKESRTGIKFALENLESMPVYRGVDYDDDESSDAKRIAYVAAQILVGGFVLTICILIVEISWKVSFFARLLGTRLLGAGAADGAIFIPVRPTMFGTNTVWAQNSVTGYSEYTFHW